MHWILLLTACALLSLFANGSVLKFGVKRTEGRTRRLLRNGNREELHKMRESLRSKATTGSQPLVDYEDQEYMVNVSIGTPPQSFLMRLSLSESLFWVPDSTCASSKCPSYCGDGVFCDQLCDPRCCKSSFDGKRLNDGDDCGWRNRFDSSKSSTYKHDGTQFAHKGEEDASGFLGNDNIGLGPFTSGDGLIIRSVQFGQASSVFYEPTYAFDGVFGLKYVTDIAGYVPLIMTAYTQGAIDAPQFTLALETHGASATELPGGTITYGGVDTDNCGDIIGTYPVHNLLLEAIGMGSGVLKPPSGHVWSASFLFSSTVIAGPLDVISTLAALAGATLDQFGLYDIACNATFPPLILTFGTDQYKIPASKLILQLNGNCILNIEQNYVVDSVIIGPAFAHQYCEVLDYDKKTVSLAKNLLAVCSSQCIYALLGLD
jgi:hypothetical protein